MKTTKIISLLLTASLLMSVSGCALFDKDDKNVLMVAQNYADAILAGVGEEIAEYMVDGDDIEENLVAFLGANDEINQYLIEYSLRVTNSSHDR